MIWTLLHDFENPGLNFLICTRLTGGIFIKTIIVFSNFKPLIIRFQMEQSNKLEIKNKPSNKKL